MLPQDAFMAERVTTSVPLIDAVYCTVKVPEPDPDEGKIGLLFAELSDQPEAFAMEIVNVALAPCCRDDGPLIVAEAPGAMLRIVTASSPTPHAFAACAE